MVPENVVYVYYIPEVGTGDRAQIREEDSLNFAVSFMITYRAVVHIGVIPTSKNLVLQAVSVENGCGNDKVFIEKISGEYVPLLAYETNGSLHCERRFLKLQWRSPKWCLRVEWFTNVYGYGRLERMIGCFV